MGGLLAQLFNSDILTFLIVFVGVPYIYLSLATDVQKDCADVIRVMMADRRINKIARYLDEISYLFNLDWWIVAAVAILLICLFYSGAFLANSAYFCTPPEQTIFLLQCRGTGGDAVTAMERLFMVYTILVRLCIPFR